jgi:hypothetical protein
MDAYGVLRFLGFSLSDLVELSVAVVFAALARPSSMDAMRWLARRPLWCMAFLALLPIGLRLALLPQYPIPSPNVSDDFSYLLLADTLRHFRLANPVHPLHPFFETFFVLQQPACASIFPLGQGLILALGWTLFGHPWAGVALSTGALCALCYWMLLAWTTPQWALAGGLLAVAEFGPLSQWMNSYWGGAGAACAGCLVFGALARLLCGSRAKGAAVLGLGIGLSWLCRPYETIFLILSVALFLLPAWRSMARPALRVAAFALPAFALSLAQNRAVTGSWTTMPYRLSQYQYGVPTTFTVQPLPAPHRSLTREQQLDYEVQSEAHGPGAETFTRYWQRWAGRIGFYRFFFLGPLYLAIPVFLTRLRDYRFARVAATMLLFSLGTTFYPFFYTHYIAAISCLFILTGVAGLERLSQWEIRGIAAGREAARVLGLLCAAHFLFWYGVRASRDEGLYAALTPFESVDAINRGDPEGRIAIRRRLEAAAGPQLVFVRYGPRHLFQEWVHNAAVIDGERIVWARDLGPEENQKLLRYYPARSAWLLEPDVRPPQLRPYAR